MAAPRSMYQYAILLLAIIAAETKDFCTLKKDTFNIASSDNEWFYDDDYYSDVVLKYHIICDNVTLDPEKSILEQIDEKPIPNFDGRQLTMKFINSSLENVTKIFMEGLKSATEYLLMNSSITSIELNALDLKLSSTLNLNNNQLSDINPILISPCALYEISLDNNNISEFDSFQNCQNLQSISMNHNNITVIKENHFSNLRSLSRLFLSSNNISIIYEKAFANLRRVDKLDLSANSLETLPSNLFNDLESLMILNISFNRLKDISMPYMPLNIILFSYAWQISLLFLNFNNFTSVPNNLNNTNGHSTILYLNNNNIKNISINDFRELNETKELHLENNLIESIEIGSFKDVKILETLNLSNNKLKKIEMGTFTGLNLLKLLNLSNNEFTILDTSVFFTMESLTKLDFNGNYLHSFNTSELHFQNLQEITVDFHNISCHSLIKYIHAIKAHGITVGEGNSFNTSNVYGIACIDISIHHHTTTSSTTVPTTTTSTTNLLTSTTKLESITEITTSSTTTEQRQMSTTSSEKPINESSKSNLGDVHTSTSHTALIVTLVLLLVVVFSLTVWFSKKYYQKRKNVDEMEYNFLRMHNTDVDN